MFTLVNQFRTLLKLARNLEFALSDITDVRDRLVAYHESVVRLVNRPYPVIVTVRGIYPASGVSYFSKRKIVGVEEEESGRYPLDDARKPDEVPDTIKPLGNEYEETPGVMGGILWMLPGQEERIWLMPQRPFVKMQVEVIGGVIRDVVIANQSQLVGYNQDSAVTRVDCSTPCLVGNRIQVNVALPGKNSLP